MIIKILRRSIALCMAVALLLVPGVATNAGFDQTGAMSEKDNGKTADPAYGFAAFDKVDKYVNKEGQTVIDYLKGDVLIKREIYVGNVIEVYLVDADGVTLTHTGTIDQTQPPQTSTKYQDEQGRTIVDTFDGDLLVMREVYDPTTGVHVVTPYDKDGNPLESKTWTDAPVEPDPNTAYDDVKTYPDETGNNKIADFIKDGVVVRREIYYPERMEVYVLSPEGQLVLDETQSQVYPTPEPLPWDDAKKYQDAKDNTVCDYLKDGIVIQREIYYKDGSVQFFGLDENGELVLQGTAIPGEDGGSGSSGAVDGGIIIAEPGSK